jgi:hypothetical protein
MNWINLALAFLEDRAFEAADTLDAGAWLRLLKYCGKVENGGRITGARLWKSCEWIRVVGVTDDEVHREAPGLWKFEADDLVVFGYPADQEEKVKANRRNGKLGGRPADPKKPHGKPDAPPRAKRKRKGRKEKGKVITTTDAGDPLIHPEDLDEYGPAPNSPDPDPDPLWNDFLEHRENFERFDDFRNRYAPNGPPAPTPSN